MPATSSTERVVTKEDLASAGLYLRDGAKLLCVVRVDHQRARVLLEDCFRSNSEKVYESWQPVRSVLAAKMVIVRRAE